MLVKMAGSSPATMVAIKSWRSQDGYSAGTRRQVFEPKSRTPPPMITARKPPERYAASCSTSDDDDEEDEDEDDDDDAPPASEIMLILPLS